MIRFFIILNFLFLGSCGFFNYTIENNYSSPVTVKSGSKELVVKAGDCIEILDFFGFGDFPINLEITGLASGQEDYDGGNYQINSSGSVVEVSDEEACIPIGGGSAEFDTDESTDEITDDADNSANAQVPGLSDSGFENTGPPEGSTAPSNTESGDHSSYEDNAGDENLNPANKLRGLWGRFWCDITNCDNDKDDKDDKNDKDDKDDFDDLNSSP